MEILNLLNNNTINLGIKVFFLICIFLFTLFLLVVFRQVISMNSIVNDENDSLILKFFSFGLLMWSVSLFFLALVIL